eukprot:jgi/Ulvmu1/10581/UM065_0035.1
MVDQPSDENIGNHDDDFDDIPKEPQGAKEAAVEADDNTGHPAVPDEDESDEDEDDDDDDDALKRMGLSKEERKRLMKMPELERELELTRRTAADEDAVFMKQLAKSGRSQKDISQHEGRDVRRSERKQASAQRPNSKLESLKEMKASRARREQKQIEDEFERRPVTSDEGEADDLDIHRHDPTDDDAEEEGEEGIGQSNERGASNEPHDDIYDEEEGVESEAGQDEVIKMQIKRDNLEDWIKHPHLQQTLKGAIVRVAGGSSGRSMWVIDDVVDGETYQFGSTQRLFSDKHLRIQSPAGDRIESIPFSVVSNCEMSMDEYHVFHGDRAKAKVPQITKHEAAAVQAQLQFARDYILSAEDINRIVRDRKAKGLVKKPLNAQRAELILERQAAQERGDDEALLRVSEKLEDVLAKIKMKQQEQGDDDRFDKQLAELDKKAAMANRSRGSTKGGVGQTGTVKDDPYSRKRTVEKVYWSTGQRNAATLTTNEITHVQQEQEEDLNRLDQVISWNLPAPAPPLTHIECIARRVLGKVMRFSPPENTQGKTVVSLDTYADMMHHANLTEMGLD